MAIVKTDETYKVSTLAVAFLWLVELFFLAGLIGSLVKGDPSTDGFYQISLISFGFFVASILFGHTVVKATLWKMDFALQQIVWNDFGKTETIFKDDIESINYKVGGSRNRSWYFFIKLKSGKCLMSPALGEDKAIFLTKRLQAWLAE